MRFEIAVLEYPIEYRKFFSKRVISIVQVRHPEVKDFDGLSLVGVEGYQDLKVLVSRLTGLSMKMVNRLHVRDWRRIHSLANRMVSGSVQ